MKTTKGFAIKNVADTYIVVPTGSNTVDFKAVITLNETGAFLWDCLSEDKTEEQLVELMTKEYDIDKDTALADIKEYLENLTKAGLIE